MNEIRRTQTIEIKELCIYILRRWRLLITAALIGAVLLGGYRTAMRVLKGPLPVLTEEEVEERQEEPEEHQKELEETIPVYTVKDIVLGAFFGGLLGVFLMAVYVFIGLFFRKTLRTGEELELWYELPLLCDLYSSGTAGKMAHRGKIDRLLDRIEGIEGPKEPKTEFAVAAAKLQLLARPEIPVVLVGTVDQEKMDAVYAAMRESLSAQPELIVAGNPMKQPEAVLRLSGASVVLVEEAETSKIREVHRLMEFLNLSKTPVIAAIVL